ncbi:MAG: 50S ribosomal protein L29 [Bacteroidota bacterium]
MYELKELKDEELKKRIKDEEENLSHLRFRHATTQIESPAKLRTVRRDIARMRSLLRERELKRLREVKEKPATQ